MFADRTERLLDQKSDIARQLFCWKHRVIIDDLAAYHAEGQQLIRRYHTIWRELHATENPAVQPVAPAQGQFTIQVDQAFVFAS